MIFPHRDPHHYGIVSTEILFNFLLASRIHAVNLCETLNAAPSALHELKSKPFLMQQQGCSLEAHAPCAAWFAEPIAPLHRKPHMDLTTLVPASDIKCQSG